MQWRGIPCLRPSAADCRQCGFHFLGSPFKEAGRGHGNFVAFYETACWWEVLCVCAVHWLLFFCDKTPATKTEGRASSGSHFESIVHHGREGKVAGVSGAAGRMASPVRKQKEVNTGTPDFSFSSFFFFFSLIWDLAHGMVLPTFRIWVSVFS